MSAKKQNSLLEVVRDAAIGYSVVVLSVICFLLTLAIVIAGVRIVVGASLATSTTNAQTAAISNVNESGTA